MQAAVKSINVSKIKLLGTTAFIVWLFIAMLFGAAPIFDAVRHESTLARCVVFAMFLSLGFFAVLMLLSVASLAAHGRPALIITDLGIQDRRISLPLTRWAQIESASLVSYPGRPSFTSVRLALSEPVSIEVRPLWIFQRRKTTKAVDLSAINLEKSRRVVIELVLERLEACGCELGYEAKEFLNLRRRRTFSIADRFTEWVHN